MEYQKTINFSDNTPYQPSKFRTKNWFNQMMTHLEHITRMVNLI